MKHPIVIPNTIVQRTFERALLQRPHKRSTLFSDIRMAFKQEFENILIKCGIEVYGNSLLAATNLLVSKSVEMQPMTIYGEKHGIEFCSKYGHDDYSLDALNYSQSDYCKMPSLLVFAQIKGFSIGNIAVLVSNRDYEIEIHTQETVELVGYSYSISEKKKKSFIALFGIRFDMPHLASIIGKYQIRDCNCDTSQLDEVQVISPYGYPVFFICRNCGQFFTCRCFKDYFDMYNDIIRFINYKKQLLEQLKKFKVRDNLCHLCTGEVPQYEYGSPMYHSTFLRRYLPYHMLLMRKRVKQQSADNHNHYEKTEKDIENELRETLGYPKIGEQWISETMLYKIVKTILAPKEVIRHYRGKELDGLELDIWIPDLKLGIEYQGEQHFKVMEQWGGEEGYKKRVANDIRKKQLCKKWGYHLIEFIHDEELTPEFVERKLSLMRSNVVTY